MRRRLARSPWPASAPQEEFLVLTSASHAAPPQAPTPVERAAPAASGRFELSYNPALDGLRAVAIVMVLLSHAHAPLFEGAFYGVDLFFVLSGYLITLLLLQEIDRTGHISYWQFYRRRFYRLMPALLFFLAAYCLFAPLLWPDLDDVYSDALVSALYLADYGIAFFDQPNTLLHMWSLSVEEHFYLIWPPLLAVLVHRTPRGQLWRVILGLVVLGWAWRLLWVVQGQQFYEIFFRFDTRSTGLLTGALLAALVREQPQWFLALRARLPHFMWLVLAVPLLMEQAWDDMNAMVWGMTVVEWATALVLIGVMVPRGPLYQMLSAKPLVVIGKLSYGIYLWHYPVVRYLRADLPWPAVVVLGFIISTALAALSYTTVERWALRWRDAPPRARRPRRTEAAAGLSGELIPASAPTPAWRHWPVDAVVAATSPTAPVLSAAAPEVAPVMRNGAPASPRARARRARAPWALAVGATAYSLGYPMSYGRRAYRCVSGHASAARSAMAHVLRPSRPMPFVMAA